METINTLLPMLTEQDLSQWAGGKILTRGRGYIKRVEGLRRTPNNELAAWVTGTEEYATLVRLAANGEHEWFCTCPHDNGPCKHAVAVVLSAAQQIRQKRDLPLLRADDDLNLVLFGEEKGAADGSAPRTVQDQSVSETGREKKPEIPKLRTLLEPKSREELLELLVAMAADYPEIKRSLLEAEQLKSGRVEPLLAALHKEIRKLTKERAWLSHWDGESCLPDYSHVRQQFKTLLAAGQADALLPLGDALWRLGSGQVEQAEDEGETAGNIADCLEIVGLALPKSSLDKTGQLLWLIDRLIDDEFTLLPTLAQLQEHGGYTAEHWAAAAIILEERLDATDRAAGKGTDSVRLGRLVDILVFVYERGGQVDKILLLMEREVERLGNYRQLVDLLVQSGRFDRARHWCRLGFTRHMDEAPGTAAALQQQLCRIAELEGRADMVAAYKAQDFFYRPGLDTFKELKRAGEKAGCWPAAREGALVHLETGQRPDLAVKKGESGAWPLPLPEVAFPPERQQNRWRRSYPQTEVLIDIALGEKRFDDAARLYQNLKKAAKPPSGDIDRKVAKGLAKSHPELALAIWRGLAEGLIAQVKPSAYVEAGGYLVQMKKVYELLGRSSEWHNVLTELRRSHKTKHRLMEILDGLSASAGKNVER